MGNEENGLKNSKNKYRRMESPDLGDLDVISEYEAQILRKSSTRKFVMASAVFASLNSVLLGYDEKGELIATRNEPKGHCWRRVIMVGHEIRRPICFTITIVNGDRSKGAKVHFRIGDDGGNFPRDLPLPFYCIDEAQIVTFNDNVGVIVKI